MMRYIAFQGLPRIITAGAEANPETNTGAVDPLSTSSPPKPSNFAGTSGESPTAASKAPAVGSANPPGYEASKSASGAVDNAAANIKQSTEAAQGSVGESAGRGTDALSNSTPTPSGSAPSIVEESAKSLTSAQSQPGPSPGGGSSLLDSLNEARSSLQDGVNSSLSNTGDTIQGKTEQVHRTNRSAVKELRFIHRALPKVLFR